MMVSLNNISMMYAPKLLFANVGLNLSPGKRYGLTGANGTGKSTLLKLIAGVEEVDEGIIDISKDINIGWLNQDLFQYDNEKIAYENGEFSEKDGFKLAEIEDTIMACDGYSSEATISSLLTGLGIDEGFHDKPLKVLSGGYKLRVLLAQVLFAKPDVLLLDEPTNHLDLLSIMWLEKHLTTSFKGILVFTTHDYEFLNNLSTEILDIDYGEIRCYTGNYKHFVKEKEQIAHQKLLDEKHIKQKINDMQNFVTKFKAKPSKAKQAMSKLKMIGRLEVQLPDIKHSSRVYPKFLFTQSRPSGKNVVRARSLSKTFRNKQVLNKINFNIKRNEKVAIIGPNGIGKSTLLKIILNKLNADDGVYEWGYETKIEYLDQNPKSQLEEDLTIWEWLTKNCNAIADGQIRKALGRMLFSGQDVNKKISILSGGESVRLLFAKIMLVEPNVVVLDEPTNHLDVEATDCLITALSQYKGTVIFVSHNRGFVQKLATTILTILPVGTKVLDNNYLNYLNEHKNIYFKN